MNELGFSVTDAPTYIDTLEAHGIPRKKTDAKNTIRAPNARMSLGDTVSGLRLSVPEAPTYMDTLEAHGS